MYGRAPRVTYLTVGSTTSKVGPGSYEVNKSKNSTSDSYAPFLSLSNRETMFHRSGKDMAAPGPGQYNNSLVKSHILGGQSLQNRSKRFEEVVSDVPGPGTYNVLPSGNTLNVQPADQCTSGKKNTKMWLQGVPNRIRFLQQLDIPSIPSPGQAFGYEENGQGLLCKPRPPSRDGSLGPAFYNPLVAENASSQKYKGVHFGQMTGKRGAVKVVEGPGPGQYEPEEDNTAHYENINVKKEPKSRAELVIPRYHEIVTLQEEKKGVPGPGQYHIKSQFEKPCSPYGGIHVFTPPFLSQAQRFSVIKEVAPPVGMYNDPRCALELLKKTTGLKRSPFGLTAVRFLSDNRTQASPGPGAYNMFDYGLAQDSMKKAYLESTRKGGFGSTARRSPIFHNKEEVSVPGPGQYKVERKSEEYYKRQRTAAFKSATERLGVSLVAKDTPHPSSYNVRESFEKTHGRSYYIEPRNEVARKRQSSFLSAAPRRSAFLCCGPNLPGPGHYTLEFKSSPKLALIGSREGRFKCPKDTTPGPGTYELSPAIVDTVLKGTFNVTLHNPLTARTPAPQSTMQPPFALSSA